MASPPLQLSLIETPDVGALASVDLVNSLAEHDKERIESAIARFKEMDQSSMSAAICTSFELASSISFCILHDSHGVLIKWLFELVGCEQPPLVEFVVQFVPVLCWAFLRRVQSPEPATSIGVLLQAICDSRPSYNALEERFQVESPVPDLSVPSIYHTPRDEQKIPTAALTATRLRDHDLRSGAASSLPTESKGILEPSTTACLELVRCSIAKFVLTMPTLSSLAIKNFCILSTRLCSDDSGLLSSYLTHPWDPPEEKQTYFAESFSVTELERLLLRGLIHAVGIEESRSVAITAITALHNKATQDTDPPLLLSTTCLMERLRYEI